MLTQLRQHFARSCRDCLFAAATYVMALLQLCGLLHRFMPAPHNCLCLALQKELRAESCALFIA